MAHFTLVTKFFDGTKIVSEKSETYSEFKSQAGAQFRSDPNMKFYCIKNEYGKNIWKFQKNKEGACIKRQFKAK